MTAVTVTFDFGDKPRERWIGPEEFRTAYEELWNTTFACDEWVGSRRRAIEATERLMRGRAGMTKKRARRQKSGPAIEYFHMGPWPLYFGIALNEKTFAAEMKRLNIDPAPDFLSTTHADATLHTFTRGGSLTMVMCVPAGRDKTMEQYAGLIAHEATHAAQLLWEHIGETTPGAEAEAYLVQYITQSCLQVVFKTGRSRKVEP